ncbi:5-methylthioadenosine/S-adenosylhomocysteine deaminase [Cyphellophora attinorum]|uniref:5-methylthioadenosine/S-adenosylhomocysteine deaminase n=1 Tax=Cyphellophora attinorum TaxID=1664694 RepID=A0A0N1HGT5_9EURO|nr:5-methylthioadenosine/S-adenosylhomocysteine deaminase [Phialophora attinorum]KPI44982.1 5-methylthioadenosine/S-adenosylhomocysteine deaminase [Phialophora attinorum]
MTTQILLQHGTVLAHQADDTVKALHDTDILVTNDKITAIDASIEPPAGARVIDCTNKIMSPGLISTHNHLWQTQLKGRHADHSLFQYIATGNMQSYNYSPSDIYLGQLAGAMESVDAGTTTVCDHAHGCYTAEHAEECLRATVASGVRAVLALAPATRLRRWDKEMCEADSDFLPEWTLEVVEKWAKLGAEADGGIEGRVKAGLGFDLLFLPEETLRGIWQRMAKAGVQLITSHVMRNALVGQDSKVGMMEEYGLLDHKSFCTTSEKDEKSIPRWLISHGNRLEPEDLELLAKRDVYISTTTETEAQMGHGNAAAFEPQTIHNACLGVDCHSNNSSSILSVARTLLQCKRQEVNARVLEQEKSPKTVKGTTAEVFNMATIQGARALGLGDSIGSLAVGKKADIVVFDSGNSPSMLCADVYDPVIAVVRHSEVRDVEIVIIDGIIRKEAGKLCDLEIDGKKTSWKEVARETKRSQREIEKRIEGVSMQKAEELFVKMFQMDMTKIVPVD